MAREKQIFDEHKAKRITEARINKGLSRQQLANELLSISNKAEYNSISVSLSAVKSWEGIGRKYSPDNTTLKAISEILEVDFDWLLYGTVQDRIEEARKILSHITPTQNNTVKFESSIFTWNGISIPDELSRSISLLYPLIKCGYKSSDIYDGAQYSEYMESSIKNSIEFYMNNLNRKEGE